MKILGFDPGKTTGWAMMEVENKKILPLNLGQDKDMSMRQQIENIKSADLVVIEDFLVDPKFARKGAFDYNDMPASQVIGSLKTLCEMSDKKFVLQGASVKPMGYGWMGMRYVKGKKNMHHWDAVAHVVYYAVKKLGALPVSIGHEAAGDLSQ